MSNDHDDLRPTDAPLDALLHERFGHDSSPDLSKVIAARHARGDGAEIAEQLAAHDRTTYEGTVLRGNQRPLLTAALVLLGIGAVVGTVWSVKNADPNKDTGSQHALQQPQVTEQETPVAQPEIREVAIDPQEPKQDPKPEKKGAKKNPLKNVGLPAPKAPEARDLEISLRVIDQHGGPIQNFELEIVYVQNENPLRLGQASLMKGVKRQPRDFKNDYTTIKGLPPGTFAVVVHDGMHAKSMSSPFKISRTGRVSVEVRMNHGGELRGRVIDANGQPVSGAVVTTEAPIESRIANSPFAEILKKRKPSLHTNAKVKTNEDGSFVIKKLAVGNYAVRAEHSEFSPAHIDDVGITVKPRKPVDIVILRGAVVHGRITKKGAPVEDYRVTVSAMIDGKNVGKLHMARTDEQGKFRIADRLPPANYRIQATTEAGPNENPFQILIQMKESEVRFKIEKGKAKVEQNIDLK